MKASGHARVTASQRYSGHDTAALNLITHPPYRVTRPRPGCPYLFQSYRGARFGAGGTVSSQPSSASSSRSRS